jgi:hypothetical protein
MRSVPIFETGDESGKAFNARCYGVLHIASPMYTARHVLWTVVENESKEKLVTRDDRTGLFFLGE